MTSRIFGWPEAAGKKKQLPFHEEEKKNSKFISDKVNNANGNSQREKITYSGEY